MTRKYRQDGSVWVRQLNISRHLLCFCFFNIVFPSFSLVYYYFARDSSKKWQEIIDKLGLTLKRFTNFSSLFCFCSFFFLLLLMNQRFVSRNSWIFLVTFFLFFLFFFGGPGSSQIRELKVSRHFFCFSFFFFFLLSILLPCAG